MVKNNQNWAEKYRATCFWEIKGQEKIIGETENFLKNFQVENKKIKKTLILQGPPGIGKTCIAYAAAKELNLEIIELNASDLRNKEELQKVLKPASKQKSFFKKGKIILVDEVDGLSYKDTGGLPELLMLIETTEFPIIMTSNDIYQPKFSSLRRKSKVLKLKEPDYKLILNILKEIAWKEKMPFDYHAFTSIAIKSKGDVRAAINDLQTLAYGGANYLNIDERDREQSIFNALKIVFKKTPDAKLIDIYDSVNMPLDEVYLWLEENIPAEYSGEELAKAYEMLSKADIFKKRTERERHWRFLIYQNLFLSAGISASKKNPRHGFTRYKIPDRVLKIWLNNQKNESKKAIIEKYSRLCHLSKRKAGKEFVYIKNILKNPAVQDELKLNEKEIELTGRL